MTMHVITAHAFFYIQTMETPPGSSLLHMRVTPGSQNSSRFLVQSADLASITHPTRTRPAPIPEVHPTNHGRLISSQRKLFIAFRGQAGFCMVWACLGPVLARCEVCQPRRIPEANHKPTYETSMASTTVGRR